MHTDPRSVNRIAWRGEISEIIWVPLSYMHTYPRSVNRIAWRGEISEIIRVPLSSVQGGVCAVTKAHNYVLHPISQKCPQHCLSKREFERWECVWWTNFTRENVPDRKERRYALVSGFCFCLFLEDFPNAGVAATPCVSASTQNTIDIKYKGSEKAQNATLFTFVLVERWVSDFMWIK